MLLPCISDACLSVGSLKYMHHFGLDAFSNPGKHWILQASLTHSISDELFVLSFVAALDAPALGSGDLGGTEVDGGKIGSMGTASLIGFSNSKFPLAAHAVRAKARSTANSHFIFAPLMRGQIHILPHHGLDTGGKRNGFKRKVAGRLIYEWSNEMSALGPKRTFRSAIAMSGLPPKAGMHETKRILPDTILGVWHEAMTRAPASASAIDLRRSALTASDQHWLFLASPCCK